MDDVGIEETLSETNHPEKPNLERPKTNRRSRPKFEPSDLFLEKNSDGAPGLLWQAHVYHMLKDEGKPSKETRRLRERLQWDEFTERTMESASERLSLVRGILGNNAESFGLVWWLFASNDEFRNFVSEATRYRLERQHNVLHDIASRARSLSDALDPGHEVEINGVLVRSSKDRGGKKNPVRASRRSGGEERT
jgi:hypothetical protein